MVYIYIKCTAQYCFTQYQFRRQCISTILAHGFYSSYIKTTFEILIVLLFLHKSYYVF